jgi:hypothetical protein
MCFLLCIEPAHQLQNVLGQGVVPVYFPKVAEGSGEAQQMFMAQGQLRMQYAPYSYKPIYIKVVGGYGWRL